MHNLIIAISAFNGMNELGGHYFSALTTARELSKKHKVSIIVVGDFLPKTLAVDDIPVFYIKYCAWLFCVCPESIKSMVNDIGAKVIIAFDMGVGVIFRLLSAQQRLGFIQVKAGGPIPKTPYINNPHQIHFSKKDYDWANKRVAYGGKVISWIPNRVADMEADGPGIAKLCELLSLTKDEIILIRIGRIDRIYESAFVGAIKTARVLRENGFFVRLIMIGAITHYELYDYLKSIMSKEDVLLSHPDHTRNARRFLAIADINLGVGRGFMEGCAAGNHMLAMAGVSDLPIVVKDESFQELFSDNFSLRAKSAIVDEQRKSDLVELAASIVAGQKVSQSSYLWFKKYFDSSCLNELYKPAIDAAAENRERVDFNIISDVVVFLVKRFLRK